MNRLKIILSVLLLALFSLQVGAQKKQLMARGTLARPTVLPATHVTPKGFTANWEQVPGAEAYCVFVYTLHEAKEQEDYCVLYEDFDRIDFGSVDNPVWGDEIYENLDIYTSLPNWSVYGYATYAQGMVGGVVYTPYVDLRNDNGRYKVGLTVYGQSGDTIEVRSSGQVEEIQKFVLDHTGLNTVALDFTNGSKDTFLHLVNLGIKEFYLDAMAITQHLEKGDKAYTLVDLNEAVMANHNSVDFKHLRYAPKATVVYYDLYAAVREYNDPEHSDRYDQVYSDYSDMMKVVLNPEATGIANVESSAAVRLCNGGVEMVLAHAAPVIVYNQAGREILRCHKGKGKYFLPLEQGLYVIKIAKKSYKINI